MCSERRRHTATMPSAGDYCGMCAYRPGPGLQVALTGNRSGRKHASVFFGLSQKPVVGWEERSFFFLFQISCSPTFNLKINIYDI